MESRPVIAHSEYTATRLVVTMHMMSDLAIFTIVAGLVTLFILVELACAVLPLLIVVTMVAPEERRALAELIAATDRSRRLRLWRALRLAVLARRARPGVPGQ
jgi:putative exporter of polyketide antibiotics